MVLKRDSPNLDILRSFAVTAVLVNHLAQITPQGQDGGTFALNEVGRAGVLVFFVHTALVLMGSLQRLEATGGRRHLLSAFYIQRLFRIYPLSIACIVVVLFAHAVLPHERLPWLTLKAVLANLALIQNLTWDPPVIGPLWSLPFELQMYLVLPFIYFLAKRRYALLYVALLWVGAAAMSSVLFSLDYRYVVMPFRFPITWFVPTFLGGVFAYIFTRKRHAHLPAVLWPMLILGIFVIFQAFPGPHKELAMSLLGFFVPQFAEAENSAVRAVAHNVAKYSYGIYLIHEPLVEICFVHLHSVAGPVRCILFALLLTICSVAGYHFVERPMIDMGHRLSSRIVRKRNGPVFSARA